jgi:hypothetical protein
MGTVCFSETLVPTHESVRRQNQKNNTVNAIDLFHMFLRFIVHSEGLEGRR